MTSTKPDLIQPNWPAPPHVRAYATTRSGGGSIFPYDSLNLAKHVGDDDALVQRNRQLLIQEINGPAEPIWLSQVHGIEVVAADAVVPGVTADGSYTLQAGKVCAVLTADCLPVLMCDRQGTRVVAVHAGWRGLAAGILEVAVSKLAVPGSELLVWLGPAIGPQVFEVGDEVYQQFVAVDSQATQAFTPNARGRWLADIYTLARQRLASRGIHEVYGGDFCTYSDSERFFSYRRDGKATGRMASLIWLN